ncbi:MAG: LCP family protein [Clostridia bacterium]|nr:LCP family protein [Clostridia bacterium]
MAEDIYFNKKKNTESSKKAKDISFGDKKYTEKINPEQLNSRPGEHSFGDIVTEKEKISSSAPVKNRQEAEKAKKKALRKKKKTRKVITVLLSVFICFFALIAILVSAVTGYVLSDYSEKDFGDNAYIEDSALMSSESVYNILLMGIDTLDTDASSRSDAMILLSVDTKNFDLKLSSFLRDSYVSIPGHGNAKLNAACVYGGPQLVCDTIEYNFGIEIDDYAKIGYDMFIKVIDAVGGVTIPEIDETEAKALAREGFKTEPGKNIDVNGTEALAYCRIRKGQSDFYRTERQREVISLVLKKLPKSDPVTLINTAKEIASSMECSVEKSGFMPLLLKAAVCLIGDIEQTHVPADGTWYDATKNYQSVLMVDFDKNKQLLNEFIYK